MDIPLRRKAWLVVPSFLFLCAFIFSSPAYAATCRLNGEDIPCNQLGGGFANLVGFGFGFFFLAFVLMVGGGVFWLMMIIHAASKPIENRPMWIVLMVLTGVVGALIYYFVVKRSFVENNSSITPPRPPANPI